MSQRDIKTEKSRSKRSAPLNKSAKVEFKKSLKDFKDIEEESLPSLETLLSLENEHLKLIDADTNKKENYKLSSSKLSSYEESEISKTNFAEKFIRRFLPEDYEANLKKIPSSGSVPVIQNPANACCRPNFGVCYLLKLYIVLTLFVTMMIYFLDPCVNYLIHPNNNQKNISTTTDPALEHCEFKLFFIIYLFLGLVIYGLIFMIYTCQLIIVCINFPWYLFESILLFGYSIILFLVSIASFFLNTHPYVNAIVLINGLLGILISIVVFRYYAEGSLPATLISKYDPDGNLLTQILSRKQFLPIF